jgi:hypothetical protein
MNIQLGDRVEGPDGPRECGRWQWHICPASSVPTTCIRPFRLMTHIGATPHGGQRITRLLAVRSKSAEVNSMLEAGSEDEDEVLSHSQGNLEGLGVEPSRYRRTLFLVACRVLGDHNQAEDAVERCLLSASWNVPHFETEGAFRSWLVRVLIDEALLILREREWAARILRTAQGEAIR